MFGLEDYEETEKEQNFLKRKNMKIQQEIPEAEAKAESPAQSERFGDFIVKYVQNIHSPQEMVPDASFNIINEIYGVLYVPLEGVLPLEVNSYSYGSIPKCYTYMDLDSLSASGVTRLHNHPYLKLRGKGTAVAVVDSGIDYQNPVFRNEQGSRIACLWDQTLPGGPEEKVPYGRLFLKEDIDRALAAESPLDIVPSTDTNGHGTMLAGIAAGNLVPEESFSGAAPEAELIVVKLKPAKRYLRAFYLFPPEAEVFQENDVMMGMAYAMQWARELGLPLSICLGIGTSQGAHVGRSPLSQYVNYVAGFSQVSVSVAAGNEGAARHHFLGRMNPRSSQVAAELRVGQKERGFAMEFWGEPPEIYNLAVQSPTGETLEISESLGAVTQELSFVFVETKIRVNYIFSERQTGNTLVYFRFLEPAPGIWRIFVRGRDDQNVNFHMWLPITGLISQDTYFLESTPYNTVTAPGDSTESITVTAYQYRDNSLYVHASRGFLPDGLWRRSLRHREWEFGYLC